MPIGKRRWSAKCRIPQTHNPKLTNVQPTILNENASMPESQITIPAITTDQMREVDRLMVEAYGIELLQMMENAGRHLAHLARRRFLEGDPRGASVVVLAGTGGNGGGGLVAARRLHGWGTSVHVVTTKPSSAYDGVPAHQLRILQNIDVPIRQAEGEPTLPAADLLLDALIGYSLSGDPRGAAARLIQAANDHPASMLSLDVPSGVDAKTGTVHAPTVRADATMTLALPKIGLGADAAAKAVGALFLADIGVPPSLYAGSTLGLDIGPLFTHADLLSLIPTDDAQFRARPLQ